jgi:hypothetical protein
LEYYDGPINPNWQRMTAEQFGLFGSKLPKDFVCQEVNVKDLRTVHFESISLRCFRGILRARVFNSESSLYRLWEHINQETLKEWFEILHEELETIPVESYKHLPIFVWEIVLNSSELMKRIQDTTDFRRNDPIFNVLSNIKPVQFATVVQNLPVIASTFLKSAYRIPERIFESCGKTEMELLYSRDINVFDGLEEIPEVIRNISSALEDEQHICYEMDPELYRQLHLLRIHASNRCRKLLIDFYGERISDFPELTNDVELWKL